MIKFITLFIVHLLLTSFFFLKQKEICDIYLKSFLIEITSIYWFLLIINIIFPIIAFIYANKYFNNFVKKTTWRSLIIYFASASLINLGITFQYKFFYNPSIKSTKNQVSNIDIKISNNKIILEREKIEKISNSLKEILNILNTVNEGSLITEVKQDLDKIINNINKMYNNSKNRDINTLNIEYLDKEVYNQIITGLLKLKKINSIAEEPEFNQKGFDTNLNNLVTIPDTLIWDKNKDSYNFVLNHGAIIVSDIKYEFWISILLILNYILPIILMSKGNELINFVNDLFSIPFGLIKNEGKRIPRIVPTIIFTLLLTVVLELIPLFPQLKKTLYIILPIIYLYSFYILSEDYFRDNQDYFLEDNLIKISSIMVLFILFVLMFLDNNLAFLSKVLILFIILIIGIYLINDIFNKNKSWVKELNYENASGEFKVLYIIFLIPISLYFLIDFFKNIVFLVVMYTIFLILLIRFLKNQYKKLFSGLSINNNLPVILIIFMFLSSILVGDLGQTCFLLSIIIAGLSILFRAMRKRIPIIIMFITLLSISMSVIIYNLSYDNIDGYKKWRINAWRSNFSDDTICNEYNILQYPCETHEYYFDKEDLNNNYDKMNYYNNNKDYNKFYNDKYRKQSTDFMIYEGDLKVVLPPFQNMYISNKNMFRNDLWWGSIENDFSEIIPNVYEDYSFSALSSMFGIIGVGLFLILSFIQIAFVLKSFYSQKKYQKRVIIMCSVGFFIYAFYIQVLGDLNIIPLTGFPLVPISWSRGCTILFIAFSSLVICLSQEEEKC